MSWSRDRARAAARGRWVVLRVVLLLAGLPSLPGCSSGGACGASCPRAVVALLVPKLDLRWQLLQTRSGAGSDSGGSARVFTGVAVWLRWQPTLYAAALPARHELSPAAWAAPCELGDVTCLAELAESEREIADALQRER
jgi:hypothetical protein